MVEGNEAIVEENEVVAFIGYKSGMVKVIADRKVMQYVCDMATGVNLDQYTEEEKNAFGKSVVAKSANNTKGVFHIVFGAILFAFISEEDKGFYHK